MVTSYIKPYVYGRGGFWPRRHLTYRKFPYFGKRNHITFHDFFTDLSESNLIWSVFLVFIDFDITMATNFYRQFFQKMANAFLK